MMHDGKEQYKLFQGKLTVHSSPAETYFSLMNTMCWFIRTDFYSPADYLYTTMHVFMKSWYRNSEIPRGNSGMHLILK